MPQKGELDWARRLTFPKKLRILTLTKLTDREESTMGGPKKHRLGYAFAAAHQTLRRKRVVAAVYVLLRFLVIVTMVAQFFNRNYESVFLCLLTLVLFLLPTIFERVLMIDLPNTL